jgi:hypothetical protein
MTHPLAYLNPDAMVAEDLGPLARNLKRLARYCACRERAMRARILGDIGDALHCDRICEELNNDLPPEWRW